MQEYVDFFFFNHFCQIQQFFLTVHLYNDFLLLSFQPFIVCDLWHLVCGWFCLNLPERPQGCCCDTCCHLAQTELQIHSGQKYHFVLLLHTLESLVVLILVFHLALVLRRIQTHDFFLFKLSLDLPFGKKGLNQPLLIACMFHCLPNIIEFKPHLHEFELQLRKSTLLHDFVVHVKCEYFICLQLYDYFIPIYIFLLFRL